MASRLPSGESDTSSRSGRRPYTSSGAALPGCVASNAVSTEQAARAILIRNFMSGFPSVWRIVSAQKRDGGLQHLQPGLAAREPVILAFELDHLDVFLRV